MTTREKVRETIKSTEEFLDNAKKSLQEEFSRTAPRFEHALDRSLDEAGQALSNAMNSIDKKTSPEQLDLLNGYRSFLQRQVEFVDARMNKIRKTDSPL